jgi:uncharacterized repeat protein (TIGR02543 family)
MNMQHYRTNRVITSLLACMVILALLPSTAKAERVAKAEKSGNYYYEMDRAGDSDYTVCITSYVGSEKSVSIPSKLGGHTVDSLASESFCGNYNIINVTIPNTVTSIGWEAFIDCGNLKEVTISSNIESIGEQAFAYCPNIQKAVFLGKCPDFDQNVFDDALCYTPENFKVYYPIQYASAWSSFTEYKKQAYCYVTINLQDGSTSSKVMTNVNGNHIKAPASPMRFGYSFGGWYKEASCTNKWNFSTTVIKSNISVYAKWTRITSITITQIKGYSDSVGVENAHWTGQPSKAPSPGKYKGYLVVNYFDVIAQNQRKSFYWDITGTNFSNTEGSVWLLDKNRKPISGLSIEILKWSNNTIRILANGYYNFEYYSGGFLAVSLDKKQPTSSSARIAETNVSLLGIIQSRGYGQCTWYVANQRLRASLSIPPKAYSKTNNIPSVGSVDNGYIPKQYDCLAYGSNHVAIILSKPAQTTDSKGKITWSFTLGEMNADWNECPSQSTRTYVLSSPNSNGQRTVLSGIGTNAKKTWFATTYYR